MNTSRLLRRLPLVGLCFALSCLVEATPSYSPLHAEQISESSVAQSDSSGGAPQETLDLAALSPERRFDFLVGTWDILVDDKIVGVATFTKIIEGTALEQEEVYFQNGTSSKALISYAYREQKKWIQSWIDIWGFHLVSKGGLEGNAMVLYTTTRYFEDAVEAQVLARQIFSDVTEAGFQYAWEISQDEGKTWTFNNGSYYARREVRGR